MAEITLEAEVGRTLGSEPSRRLRRDGRIPGVIYGHGTAPVHVSVSARELRTALSGEAGSNALLALRTEGATYLTMARELQRDPVRHTVLHVDFQIVRRDEVMAADVSVNLVGDAVEVHHGDGLVDQQLFTLTVNARPADIPTSLELDISTLTIGAALHVGDLPLPSGVSTDVDPETVVVVGQPPRVPVSEEGAEAAAGGATAEPAAPAEA